MKTLVFGEILWDIIEGDPHLGGAPLNFAAHVNQCGHESAIISCLGNDELGDKALSLVINLGVDTSLIQRAEKRTGFVPVTLINGQPQYVITPDVAFDYIQSEDIDQSKIESYDTFYFGSLIQRSPDSNKALYDILSNHQFENIFYDVNLRKDAYSKSIIENSLAWCTLLKVNDDEVETLSEMLFGKVQDFETFSQFICQQYPKINTIIITAGKDGCLIYSNKKLVIIPTELITVVDTVGAGDSFSAAFACVYANTEDPIKAAQIANKVGGFVASSHGPIPQYSDDILRLITLIE
ncbi:MAG: fructokinase [Cyclobacteriaceae bacterium]|jgi:fructokinase